MHFQAVIFVSIVLFIPYVQSEWKWMNFSGGGYFTGVAVHPSGILYGRTDVGGAYRSDDMGQNWNWISSAFAYPSSWSTQGIAIDPKDVNTVYLALGQQPYPKDPGQGVWKTIDGGKTYKRVLHVNFAGNDALRIGGECIVIDPADNNKVWAGARQGLFMTEDAGETWVAVAPKVFNNITAVGTIHIHENPKFAGQVWVGGYGSGLYLSLDYGKTWETVNTGKGTLVSVRRVVRMNDGTTFFIGNENQGSKYTKGVYYRVISSNWVDTSTYVFEELTHKFLQHDGEPDLIHILKNGSLVYATATGLGSLGISNDKGETYTYSAMQATGKMPIWRAPNTTGLPYGRAAFVQDPKDENHWITGTGDGPMESRDNGNTWQFIAKGVGEVVMFTVDFHPDRDLAYFGSMDLAGFFGTLEEIIINMRGVLTNPTVHLGEAHRAMFWGDTWVVLGNQRGGQGWIATTHDSGKTWKRLFQQEEPINKTMTGFNFIDCVGSLTNPNDYLVKDKGGFWRTKDGGITWKRVATMLWETFQGNQYVEKHLMTRDATIDLKYYVMGFGSGLWTSNDGGDTFTHMKDWHSAFPSVYGALASDQARSGHLWALMFTNGTQNRGKALWHSTDGGYNWKQVGNFSVEELFGKPGGIEVATISAYDGRVALWAKGPEDTEGFSVYYSPNVGETWQRLTNDTFHLAFLNGIGVDPRHIGRVYATLSGRSIAVWDP